MIQFFSEDIDFTLEGFEEIKEVLLKVCTVDYSYRLVSLNYILCSDEYLLKINQDYLNHDTYTDIITFDQSEEEKVIEGDIFISIPRVHENAETFGVPFTVELRRVLAHGLLHLLGLGDKTEVEKVQMREAEAKVLLEFEKRE